MKTARHAVSISLGSSRRDKSAEIDILGERVHIERIGTDGDLAKAQRLFSEMDGKVDALGVGGAVLGLMVDGTWHSMRAALALTSEVHRTPLVDGTGLKMTLEKRVASVIDWQLAGAISARRALVTMGVDRWGEAIAFDEAGYECCFGDVMFGLGFPLPIRSQRMLKFVAKMLMPVATRLPFDWVYPLGEAQNRRTPKWQTYFNWAGVISGDCHYITRYMPDRLDGKVIVTNTTTPQDRQLFKEAGAKYLVTSTPVLDGRSFGTNMMEAALVAASGRRTPVDYALPDGYFQDIAAMVCQLGLEPCVQEL